MAEGQSAGFWRAVEHWRTPASGYLDSGWSRFRTNPHGLRFADHYSVLAWDCALHFSTLKKAQNGNALILRGWNPGLTPLPCVMPDVNTAVQSVTLAETPVDALNDAVAPGTPLSWRMDY